MVYGPEGPPNQLTEAEREAMHQSFQGGEMQKPDAVVAKDHGGNFTPHPEGQFAAVCVDVIDLGERVRDYKGHRQIKPSMAIVFATGAINEDGDIHTVSAEFTVSMNSKANLRKFLEKWRGKKYSKEQAEEGVPVHKLVGCSALLTIEQRTSQHDREYAIINNVSPVPEPMRDRIPPTTMEYERPAFWADKKAAYQAEVLRERSGSEPDEYDAPNHADDDIPF